MNISQKCVVDDCTRSKHNNQTVYCGRHAARFKKYGDATVTLRKSWIEAPYTPKRSPRAKAKFNGTKSSYAAMKSRCMYRSNKDYMLYGGRGITISSEWLGVNGYSNFLKDMGERPDNMSLDRINNDKGYCKENCQWATSKMQANNRRPARR